MRHCYRKAVQTEQAGTASREIDAGERFAFGDNWLAFLSLVDERRIEAATRALTDMLGTGDLTGRRFLDVGSGSGLSSLAAYRLGAEVVSFDYDMSSANCTSEMRHRFGGTGRWQVHQGSVLDAGFVAGLGSFDVVYSWGVLHHTGAMWQAFDNVVPLVRPGGQLFVAIYNDQGGASRRWAALKKRYVSGSHVTKRALQLGTQSWFGVQAAAASVLHLFHRSSSVPAAGSRARGMDRHRDLVDWVGGYPFEVAKPEEVFSYCRDRGFTLDRLVTCGGGLGCNEFVFTRSSGS